MIGDRRTNNDCYVSCSILPESVEEATMQRARYVQLFADECGESHFAEIDVHLEPVDFAPPAAPLHVAALFPASACGLVGGPPDWDGTVPHPAPHRQLFCTLRGEFEVTASDGTVRRFPAGSMLLLEDTTGKGHTTRILGDNDVLIVSVTLAP
jgi:hypothetical protein